MAVAKAGLVMQLNNNEKRVKCSIIRSLMLLCTPSLGRVYSGDLVGHGCDN